MDCEERRMMKDVYFDDFDGSFWPDPKELEPYFLAPPGKRWTFKTGNDSWGLSLEGVDGTGHLERFKGRIDIRLGMWGHPEHGVLLMYERIGGGFKQVHYSAGDLKRLREWVRSLHGDPMPVGLFIPYDRAWIAVKEFMQTEGGRSSRIDWVAAEDLPPNTFPDRFHMPSD
jgi:hypothetical protein